MGKELQKTTKENKQIELINELAKQEGIPASGITILGGKPYINVTGLDVKLKNKCKEEKLVHTQTKAKCIQEGTKENGWYFGYHAEIVLFDKEGFKAALGKIQNITDSIFMSLAETYTYRFTAEGFASILTTEGIGWKYEWVSGYKQKTVPLPENIRMMAERRATNRAKREATGTGLTSLDELPLTSSQAGIEKPVESPSEKPEDKSDATPKASGYCEAVKAYVNTIKFKDWCKENAILTFKDVKFMLEVYHAEKDPADITLEDVKDWENNLNRMKNDIEEVTPENGDRQRESKQGPEKSQDVDESPSQGELGTDTK